MAKFMFKIMPNCFDSARILEYPKSREQLKVWEFNKIINHNTCVKVLQKVFGLDMNGVSGKDILQGDPKFLASVMWRLGEREA